MLGNNLPFSLQLPKQNAEVAAPEFFVVFPEPLAGEEGIVIAD